MVTTLAKSTHPLADLIERIESGGALLPESPDNVVEVVGILKSYGVVLGAYSRNLKYIADQQFLVLFPFFKYFDGEFSIQKLFKHWWHDRINYEFSEYCMKAMMWHGGGGLDAYLDTPEFEQLAEKAIAAKLKSTDARNGKSLPKLRDRASARYVLLQRLGAVLDGHEYDVLGTQRSL
jgi:CO2 hydration protein (ChpXY)